MISSSMTLTEQEGETTSYTTCQCNCGATSQCVFKAHVRDGVVVAVEPDDRVNTGVGREDEILSEQDLIKTIKEGRNLDYPIHMPAFKNTLADWEISFILTYMKSKWDIIQLNYQHGFMTLTPQATPTIITTPSPTVTGTTPP